MFSKINPKHEIIREKCDVLADSRNEELELKEEIKKLVIKHNYKFDHLQDFYNFENAMRRSNVNAIKFFIEMGNNPFDNNSPFHERLFIVHNTLEYKFNKLKSRSEINVEMVELLEPLFSAARQQNTLG